LRVQFSGCKKAGITLSEYLIPIAFFGGIILVAIVVIYVAQVFENKRKEAIAKIAGDLGLTFYADGDPELQSQMTGFKLFNSGRSRRLYNMVHGKADGVDLAIFDYKYTTGSGKNSSTHNQTVVFIGAADLNLPQFTLCPESFFAKVGSFFGFEDIDFESHPKFSDNCYLTGADEEAIRRTFTGEVLRFFEENPGITTDAFGRSFIFYRGGQREKPEKIRDLMGQAFKLYAMLNDQT